MRPYLSAGLVAALAAALGLLVAPFLPGGAWAAPASFVTACATAFASVAIGVVGRPRAGRPQAVVLLAGLCTLGALFASHATSPWAATLVDPALVAVALVVGGAIGHRVEYPGHLLPAGVVAACADLVSVFHPHGPSRAIAASERALSVAAFSFAVPGEAAVAPAIGVGDLIFAALALSVFASHRLRVARAALLLTAGALAAGAISFAVRAAVPALPTMAALLIVGTPAARTLRPRDRMTALIAVALAIGAAAGLLLRG